MAVDDEIAVFTIKSLQNFDSAASELANGRHDACANRCYYSCFQAAIVALLRAGIRPSAARRVWGHDFVQSQFAGQLIN